MKFFSKKVLTRYIVAFGLVMLFLPMITFAQSGLVGSEDVCQVTSSEKAIALQLEIPGVTQEIGGKHYIKNVGCYIVGIYRYFAGAAGILATVMMMYGGFKYIVSFGSQQKISDAKDTIVGAMVGLLLALSSYAILYFINPNLTTFRVNLAEHVEFLDPDFVWCQDGDEAIEGTKNCGDKGRVKDSNQECMWPGDCPSGEMCWRISGGGAKCNTAELICNEYTAGGSTCKTADDSMVASGETNFACARVQYTLYTGSENHAVDVCEYQPILGCSGSGWERVKCQQGATNDVVEKCWDSEKNVPWSIRTTPNPVGKDGTRLSGREQYFTCTNSERPGEGTDSVCCADVNSDVDCRDTCNDDELDITGGTGECKITVGTEEMDLTGKNDACSADELSDGKRCCVEIELRNEN